MPREEHHVVSTENGWAVKKNNAHRSSGNYETKADAVKAGREMSHKQNTELIVHNQDGKISYSDSHGNDPCPPRDKK